MRGAALSLSFASVASIVIACSVVPYTPPPTRDAGPECMAGEVLHCVCFDVPCEHGSFGYRCEGFCEGGMMDVDARASDTADELDADSLAVDASDDADAE